MHPIPTLAWQRLPPSRLPLAAARPQLIIKVVRVTVLNLGCASLELLAYTNVNEVLNYGENMWGCTSMMQK